MTMYNISGQPLNTVYPVIGVDSNSNLPNIFSVYMYGDVQSLTDKSQKASVTFKFVYPNGNTVDATGKVKLQGSGSMRWAPHYNYTISNLSTPISFTTYDGTSRVTSPYTNARTRQWGSRNKFVLKADHMDHTHARNIVAARIWGDIVRSRESTNDASSPLENLLALPNCGAVDGFPCKVYVNDEYYGLYCISIPKDEKLFGMGEDGDGFVCGEDWGPGNRMSANAYHQDVFEFPDGDLAVITEDDYTKYTSLGETPLKAWVVEYDEDNCSWIPTSLNGLLQVVNNTQTYPDGSTFKTALENILDIDSAIDYLLFIRAFGLVDNYARNLLLAKYNDTKWFCSAYDLDTAFGIIFWGDVFYSVANYTDFSENTYTNSTMKLWKRILVNYRDKIKSRYSALRGNNGALSNANVYDKIIAFCKEIPDTLLIEQGKVYEKHFASNTWPVLPGSGASNMCQMITWYQEHMRLMDLSMDEY